MQRIVSLEPSNINPRAKKQGPMLKKTRDMLDDFYRPYNKRLADLLCDDKFTWEDVENTTLLVSTRID